MKISVAMAVYNGEKYLKEQINSILCQIGYDAELVISIDPSGDASETVIDGFVSTDHRVKKVSGQGNGLIKNFENAILNCNGEIIFLADQDDVWIEGKVDRCISCFKDEIVMAVVHDAVVCSGELDNVLFSSFFEYKNCRSGIIKNVIRNSYMGCCMAFRRDLLKWVIPFPDKIPMHDQWIGIMAELHGKTMFLNETLIKYRRHGDNKSNMAHAGIFRMIIWRVEIVLNLLIRNLIV